MPQAWLHDLRHVKSCHGALLHDFNPLKISYNKCFKYIYFFVIIIYKRVVKDYLTYIIKERVGENPMGIGSSEP